MKEYRVNDKSVVIILSKKETRALISRLEQHTGVAKSQQLISAEQKIINALGE